MSPRATTSAEPEEAPTESLRILIADDDHDAVLTLSTLFREEGYQTKAVYRGDQVVQAIVEFNADAALVDLMMPGMTGLDVAREMRQRYRHTGPFLIAVTAWNTPTDKTLSRAAGFDEHVGKPYDPEQLITLVRAGVLERRNRMARESIPGVFHLGTDTLHSRLLRKLTEILGGVEPVRRALMVPTADLSRWISGAEPIPRALFMKATDLLVNSTPAPGAMPGARDGRQPDATDEDPV